MENVRETILDNADEVTELSESILSDITDAKKGLAALLTDRDALKIYGDIDLLMDTLESINASATRIGWLAIQKTRAAAETKSSLKNEDNITTE